MIANIRRPCHVTSSHVMSRSVVSYCSKDFACLSLCLSVSSDGRLEDKRERCRLISAISCKSGQMMSCSVMRVCGRDAATLCEYYRRPLCALCVCETAGEDAAIIKMVSGLCNDTVLLCGNVTMRGYKVCKGPCCADCAKPVGMQIIQCVLAHQS